MKKTFLQWGKEKLCTLVGYPVCDITGESLMNGYVQIMYTENTGLMVGRSATLVPADNLAKAVYAYLVRDGRVEPNATSVQQIKQLNNLDDLEIFRI